ncbi:MAG: polyprenyl synthetase family protein [Salinisphaeraceae bacterium]|nr:polyprenyl synthetase family protein [Salinisphaeraceae bacterium]
MTNNADSGISGDFGLRVETYRQRILDVLDRCLPKDQIAPKRLHAAMRYATLNGGKRLRPLLVYATGEVLSIPAKELDAAAAAVELIHAYSLVHDDLPAMDDDDLRRGQATCHIAYDEATAILVGDALQSMAFRVLSDSTKLNTDPATQLQMIHLLAEASGSNGMAGGQAMDLEAVGLRLDLVELENMHIHKTGALIRASVLLACLCKTPHDAAERDALDRYAKRIGLAFQIQDDILDDEADTDVLGKTAGADRALNKPTFPAILGMSESKARAAELTAEAIAALNTFGERAQPLIWLAEHITQRHS